MKFIRAILRRFTATTRPVVDRFAPTTRHNRPAAMVNWDMRSWAA